MNVYEIVVCNLGYDNSFLCSLNGKIFKTLEKAIEEVTNILDMYDNFIDGFKIIEKFDMNNTSLKNGYETLTIIQTEIFDRLIYIRKL